MAEYLCEEDMSTGEYISRDVALRQLNATCLATDCNNYNGVMCRACAYADAMDFIEAIPAADVQHIRQLYDDMCLVFSTPDYFGKQINMTDIMHTLESDYGIDWSKLEVHIESESEWIHGARKGVR